MHAIDPKVRAHFEAHFHRGMSSGRLPLALYCALRLEAHGLARIECLPLFASVAAGYGHYARAAELYAEAAGLQRGSVSVPTDTGVLLIREWGHGFFSDVDHVLGQLLVAEISGRTPVVYWGGDSLFVGDEDANAWDLYFAPVSPITVAEVVSRSTSVYPHKWRSGGVTGRVPNRREGDGSELIGPALLQRPEDVVVSDFHTFANELLPWIGDDSAYAGATPLEVYQRLVRKFIRVHDDVAAQTTAFVRQHLAGPKSVAIHFRAPHDSKTAEGGGFPNAVSEYLVALQKQLHGMPDDTVIYLLTDFAPAIETFQATYGDRVVCTAAKRTDNPNEPDQLDDFLGVRAAREVLIDATIALACDAFIGDGVSNVSRYIRYAKPWPPEAVTMVRPDLIDTDFCKYL